MRLFGWLRRLRRGDGLKALSAASWDRVCNVLETIEGVGCTIQKTQDGYGWKIVVGSSDVSPLEGDGYEETVPPGGPGAGEDPCTHSGSDGEDGQGEGREHPGIDDDEYDGSGDGQGVDDPKYNPPHPGEGDCA